MSTPFKPQFRADLPAPSTRWNGYPRYNFVGGHNDSERVPVDRLIAAAASALKREGPTLSHYGLNSGPQGYAPLRTFVADALTARAGMACEADDVLLTSGSLQALDLVFAAFLEPGDTVVLEQANYGGTLSRLERLGVAAVRGSGGSPRVTSSSGGDAARAPPGGRA